MAEHCECDDQAASFRNTRSYSRSEGALRINTKYNINTYYTKYFSYPGVLSNPGTYSQGMSVQGKVRWRPVVFVVGIWIRSRYALRMPTCTCACACACACTCICSSRAIVSFASVFVERFLRAFFLRLRPRRACFFLAPPLF